MHRLVPSLLLLAACAPNNATLDHGSYIAFLSDGTSLSLAKEEVPLDQYKNQYAVDCREFETKEDEAALRLPGAIDICKKNSWPPVYESWATQAGFQVVQEDLDPWRGEALITSEGDLQIAFHHHIPGGQDMRFVFAIDPDFAPQTCIQNEKGETERVPKDGDWVENWSAESLDWVSNNMDKYGHAYDDLQPFLDGGKVFFLNALSYQYNPLDPAAPAWNLPEEWVAGSAQGKFVEEYVYQRRARYGDPQVYNAIELSGSTEYQYVGVTPADLFWCDLDAGQNPLTDACGGASEAAANMVELDDQVHQIGADIHDELNLVMQPDKDLDPVYEYAPLVHTNFWRAPDGAPAGLDGWSELHYNYVVFSKDSDLTAGGAAKGAFSLVLDASESSTRVFVHGQFTIDRIKKDKWTTANLSHDKLIENGTTLCSAASPEDADPAAFGDK